MRVVARMRPSPCARSTISVSWTAFTRAVMIPTASSTDIIGPPKAKQSSESCAIAFRYGSRFGRLDFGHLRLIIPEVDCGCLYHICDNEDFNLAQRATRVTRHILLSHNLMLLKRL